MTSTPVTQYPGFANDTLDKTMSLCRDIPCIFYAVMNSFICVLGVAGNGFVMWIAGFRIKKSVSSTWYLSLAVSDFIYCSILPLSIIHEVVDNWIFGLFMCKLFFYIMCLNWFSSIFLLVIISVDRCVVIMFPVWARNKRTVRKASLAVLVAWIISAGISIPSSLFLDVIKMNKKSICLYNYSSDLHKTVDVVCQFMFLFMIPYLIIIICYVVIIQKLRSNQMTRSKKPFKIMTVLIVTFLICWLPYNTVSLMSINQFKYETFLKSAYPVALIFANVNSCLNPFLYAFMGKDFKSQCHALLSKMENALEEEEGGHHGVQGTVTTQSGENLASTTL